RDRGFPARGRQRWSAGGDGPRRAAQRGGHAGDDRVRAHAPQREDRARRAVARATQRPEAPREDTMLRALSLFAVGVCATVLTALPALAQTPPDLTLTRIDCGTGATPTDVGQRFTDTFAYKDLKLTFTFSCYLIKRGSEYMVWDTGFAPGTNPNA